jgi:hypothetical protein
MNTEETNPPCHACGRPFEEGEAVCLDTDEEGHFERFHEHCLV